MVGLSWKDYCVTIEQREAVVPFRKKRDSFLSPLLVTAMPNYGENGFCAVVSTVDEV